ncbi:MAG: molybdate ABC transporter substrate-binding protein [Betaproteobacteria bacterium]
MVDSSFVRAAVRGVVAGAVSLLALLCASVAIAAESPLIAAASDLRFALDEIAAQFERETGQGARIVYGSSGNFRRQIAEGAPFELFLSADEAYVLALVKEGHTVDTGVPYAIGRIALVVPAGSPLALDGELRDLALAAGDGRVRKFALANPEHAPYGRAAQEALTAVGAWDGLQGRLVFGENVAQAAQFATSGSAQGGIVALSLAMAPGALGTARFAAIPERLHRPLIQRMVLTKRATAAAREFYRYMQQPAARNVFRRYGFTLPGE